ncbi:hypothetical protein EDB19DRAFT_1637220, partial [Suillus lakei]
EVSSLHYVKKMIVDPTSVKSIIDHRCINSCGAFIGLWADLDACPTCGEPHYDQKQLQWSHGCTKVPHAVFQTIQINPQLQALWREQGSVKSMRYRNDWT